MRTPNPTPIYRIVHIDNLPTLLARDGLHAPNHTPADGLPYRTIHNVSIQDVRHARAICCGRGGTVHDYLAFYFGYLSPMLLQLKTGRVTGYDEGQGPLIYLVSTVQAIVDAGLAFAFSDGHGIAAFTSWFDDPAALEKVDWAMVYERYWADTVDDPDRQRRKQAEFLVHQNLPWSLVQEIGVHDRAMRDRVEEELAQVDSALSRPVYIRPAWYYHE